MPESAMRSGGKPGISDVIRAIASHKHDGLPSRPVEPDPDGKPVLLAPGEAVINAKDVQTHLEPLVDEVAKTGTVTEKSLHKHALPILQRLVKPKGLCRGGKGYQQGGDVHNRRLEQLEESASEGFADGGSIADWLGQKTHGLLGTDPGVQDTRKRLAGEKPAPLITPSKQTENVPSQSKISSPTGTSIQETSPKEEAPVGGMVGLTAQRLRERKYNLEEAEKKALGYAEGGTTPLIPEEGPHSGTQTTLVGASKALARREIDKAAGYQEGGSVFGDDGDKSSVLGKTDIFKYSPTSRRPAQSEAEEQPLPGGAEKTKFGTTIRETEAINKGIREGTQPIMPTTPVVPAPGFNKPIGGYVSPDVISKVQNRLFQSASAGMPMNQESQEMLRGIKTQSGMSLADTLDINKGIRERGLTGARYAQAGFQTGGKVTHGMDVRELPVENIDITSPVEVKELPVEHQVAKPVSQTLPKIGVQELPVESIDITSPVEVKDLPVEHHVAKPVSQTLPKIGVQELPVEHHVAKPFIEKTIAKTPVEYPVGKTATFPKLARFAGRVLGGPAATGIGLALHSKEAGAGSDIPPKGKGETEAGFKYDTGYQEGGAVTGTYTGTLPKEYQEFKPKEGVYYSDPIKQAIAKRAAEHEIEYKPEPIPKTKLELEPEQPTYEKGIEYTKPLKTGGLELESREKALPKIEVSEIPIEEEIEMKGGAQFKGKPAIGTPQYEKVKTEQAARVKAAREALGEAGKPAAEAAAPAAPAAASAAEAAETAAKTVSRFPRLARLGGALGELGGLARGAGRLVLGPVGTGVMAAVHSPDVGVESDITPKMLPHESTEAGFTYGEPTTVPSYVKPRESSDIEKAQAERRAIVEADIAAEKLPVEKAAPIQKEELPAGAKYIKDIQGRNVGVSFGPREESYIKTATPTAGIERVAEGFRQGRYKMKETPEDVAKTELARARLDRIYGNLERMRAEDQFQREQAALSSRANEAEKQAYSGLFTNKPKLAQANEIRQLMAEREKTREAAIAAGGTAAATAAYRGAQASAAERRAAAEEGRLGVAQAKEAREAATAAKGKPIYNKELNTYVDSASGLAIKQPADFEKELTTEAVKRLGEEGTKKGLLQSAEDFAKSKEVSEKKAQIMPELLQQYKVPGINYGEQQKQVLPVVKTPSGVTAYSITSNEDYRNVPAEAYYMGPDGVLRKKPA